MQTVLVDLFHTAVAAYAVSIVSGIVVGGLMATAAFPVSRTIPVVAAIAMIAAFIVYATSVMEVASLATPLFLVVSLGVRSLWTACLLGRVENFCDLSFGARLRLSLRSPKHLRAMRGPKPRAATTPLTETARPADTE